MVAGTDDSPYILGLDLHGTLLEPGEKLRPELVPAVARGLARLRGRALRCLCTGNDLEFVRRKVPAEVRREIDGCVLETGCSFSREGLTEEVATSTEEQERIRRLEKTLRAAGFAEINYFAHRLTTISMFCDRPAEFARKVEAFVTATPFHPWVQVTWSSVAVDVLPAGYNKHRGLVRAAEGRRTIGMADSMNDLALLADSDYALAPKNLAPELLPILAATGRKTVPLPAIEGLLPAAVVVATRNETEGVIELLSYLDRALPGIE